MFIRIDPSTVDNNKLAVFENELQNLPEQRVEDLIIEDYLYEKLKYIFEQNQINAIVSFKKIMNKFKISYVTAASRLDSLEKKGFIYTKKQGKLRAIFITDKGKSLLQKRKTA
jgi:predicted transcriptional regulator